MSSQVKLTLSSGKKEENDKLKEKAEMRRQYLWMRAFLTAMVEFSEGNHDVLEKAVYAGVRAVCLDQKGYLLAWQCVNQEDCDAEELVKTAFSFHTQIVDLFGMMTPNQVIRLFPPRKEYDGEKYGCKDWYTVMDAVKKFGPDKVLGDKAMEFLAETNNLWLQIFCIAGFHVVDDLRRMNGQQGMLEDFFQMSGMKPSSVLHMVEGEKGQKIFVDGDGNFAGKAEKPKPRFLKVINGCQLPTT